MRAKILVVEDAPDMVVLIKGILKEKYDLTICKNGSEVFSAIEKDTFDLILCDLMLPDISGFELVSVFREHNNTSNAFVVIMSAKEDITSKVTAYNLGAINYLEKPFDSRILRSVIKSLINRKQNQQEIILELADLKIDLTAHKVTHKDNALKLTQSEYKILCYLLQRDGQVVSREKLIQVIDPSKLDVSDRIIDSHISSIRKELKSSKLQVKAAYGEGYILSVKND